MKKALILSSLIIMIVAFSGCDWLQKEEVEEQVSTNIEVSENVNVEIEANDDVEQIVDSEKTEEEINTSDWQVYVDDSYISLGVESHISSYPYFLVKYPSSWLLSESLGGASFFTPSMSAGELPKGEGDVRIDVFSYGENDPMTLQECYERLSLNKIKKIYNVDKNIIIDNYQAIKFDYQTANIFNRTYCIIVDNNTLGISGHVMLEHDLNIVDTLVKTIDFSK